MVTGRMTIISLDIDDTISVFPGYFAKLSHKTYLDCGQIIINSSRSETPQSRLETEEQLKGWGIQYDKLYLFRSLDEVEHLCPHPEFNWDKKYLWQKIHHCRMAGALTHYDDDNNVIELFKLYAPDIKVIDVKNISTQN